MRMRVAAKKILQPQDVAIVGAADNDRTTRPFAKDAHAPQDQRPHDDLAKLGFRDQQRPQPLRRENKRLDRTICRCVHQRWTAGELREFAEESTLLVRDHRLGLIEIDVFGNGNLAGKDDHEARSDFAHRHDPLPVSKGADFAKPADALDLQGIELRDHLIAALVENRWGRCRRHWHTERRHAAFWCCRSGLN